MFYKSGLAEAAVNGYTRTASKVKSKSEVP
jgi:hypothetical protein